MKKLFLIFIVIFLLAGCGKQASLVNVNLNTADLQNSANQQLPDQNNSNTEPKVDQTIPEPITTQTEPIQIPSQFDLKVAFASQAPLGNWDALHQEACEEASIITVAKYFKKEGLSNQIMENEIQQLVAWETANGYLVDLTAQEATDILKTHFGLNAKLVSEVTVDRIKYEISQGHLVIIPAAGRLLGNPNFTGAGPIYHMLVVRGYDSRYFITNDVGTRKGNGYKYVYQTLINSVHDWNPNLAEGGMTDAEMATGRKVMIVIDGVSNK